ncbi:MAG TPA: hypothetical protein VEK82_08360, partial [Stellaceae bacterium]|nr:hypothetical protein [Stellaceae bacterium]
GDDAPELQVLIGTQQVKKERRVLGVARSPARRRLGGKSIFAGAVCLALGRPMAFGGGRRGRGI